MCTSVIGAYYSLCTALCNSVLGAYYSLYTVLGNSVLGVLLILHFALHPFSWWLLFTMHCALHPCTVYMAYHSLCTVHFALYQDKHRKHFAPVYNGALFTVHYKILPLQTQEKTNSGLDFGDGLCSCTVHSVPDT